MKKSQEATSYRRVCVLHYDPNRIIEDMVPALREAGLEVLDLDVRRQRLPAEQGGGSVFSIDGRLDYLPYVYGKIESFDPDFILVSNSQGVDTDGLLYAMAELKEIPLVNWFLDNPYFAALIRRPKYFSYVFYATFDPVYAKQMQADGYSNVFSLSLGANPARFSGARDTIYGLKHGILFVGKSGLESTRGILGEIELGTGKLPQEMKQDIMKFVEQSAQRLMLKPEITPFDLIDGHVSQYPEKQGFYYHSAIKPLVANMIDLLASFYQRRNMINATAQHNVTVAGDKAWQSHLRQGVRHIGLIPYEQVGLLYRGTSINLNVSRYQLKCSGNQRVFDVPAAEGFLITDYRPGLEKMFEPGKEVIFYENEQDLKDKVEYYMARPQECMNIARHGNERLMQDHTYNNRTWELMDKLSRAGAKKGTVKKGEVTQRVLSDHLDPYLEKLYRIFRTNGMVQEANLIGGKRTGVASVPETGNPDVL